MSRNDITGDALRSRQTTDDYRAGHDRIFGSHFDESCTIKDHFKIDEAFETRLAFPCCVCIHRHGTDRDEPCIRCEHNLNAWKP